MNHTRPGERIVVYKIKKVSAIYVTADYQISLRNKLKCVTSLKI